MDCTSFQEYLDRYLDGALMNDELSALEAHAAECDVCACQWRAARQLRELLADMPDEIDVPLEAQAGWRNAVRAEAARGRGRKWIRLAGGIAAALVVLLGASLALKPFSGEAPLKSTAGVAMESSYAAMEDARPDLAIVQRDGSQAAGESAAKAAAKAAPMREVSLKVNDLDDACAYIHDLTGEYEGSIDEQRFESGGKPCANLFIDIPSENAGEFLAAARQYAGLSGAADSIPDEVGSTVSILLVLRTE